MSDDVTEEKPEIRNTLPTTTVYRIVKLEHLISDIENEIITFSHPTNFDDVKEYKKQDALFVQCWSKEKESPMMWELYSKDKLGIMIKFDVERFNNNNIKYGNSFKPFPFDSYWRDIEYDFEDFEKTNKNPEPLEYLFHKRKGYEYEKECRWVINLGKTSWHPTTKLVENKYERYPNLVGNRYEIYPNLVGDRYERYPKIITSYSNNKYTKFIQVPFERRLWNMLINEIIIDPRSNDDYFRYIKELLTVTFNKPFNNIKRSTFWGKDEKLEYNHNEETAQLYYFSKGCYDLIINNIENNDSIEELKIWLFSEHDKLFFSGLHVKIIGLVDYKKIDTLLQKDDIITNFYVMSYLILNFLKSMYLYCGGINNIFYENMYILLEKAFTSMNSFLDEKFKITQYINKDFIDNFIKFLEKEGREEIYKYLEYWKEIYLICQESIPKFHV